MSDTSNTEYFTQLELKMLRNLRISKKQALQHIRALLPYSRKLEEHSYPRVRSAIRKYMTDQILNKGLVDIEHKISSELQTKLDREYLSLSLIHALEFYDLYLITNPHVNMKEAMFSKFLEFGLCPIKPAMTLESWLNLKPFSSDSAVPMELQYIQREAFQAPLEVFAINSQKQTLLLNNYSKHLADTGLEREHLSHDRLFCKLFASQKLCAFDLL